MAREAAHMAGHVTGESAPPPLRLRRRVLAPPSDVIKAAAAEPGGAPVLEASPEQECGPQERGLACAVPVHIPAPPPSRRVAPGVQFRRFLAGSHPGARGHSVHTGGKNRPVLTPVAPSDTSLGWEESSRRREKIRSDSNLP